MPSDQPDLNKKTSFRDRLKWRSRSSLKASEPSEDPPPKPRSAYRPKHAPADFSRVAVCPHIPQRSSSDPAKEGRKQGTISSDGIDTRRAASVENQGGKGTYNPILQPQKVETGDAAGWLQEIIAMNWKEPAGPLPRTSLSDNTHRSSAEMRSSQIPPRLPVPGLISNMSTAAASVASPSNQQAPLRHSEGSSSADTQNSTINTQTAAVDPTTSPSDFELFMAQAEADDRARRQKAWQTIRNRSFAAPIVRPNPHQQFAYLGIPTAPLQQDTSLRDRSHRTPLDSEAHRRQDRRSGDKSGEAPGNRPRADASYLPAGAQQKTLHRETSFGQRIAHYIRPSKNEGQNFGHSTSIASMRKS